MIWKKLISHFDMNVFLRVVWILSQLTAFVLKLQQENLHEQRSTVWKTAKILQYLLESSLLYLAVHILAIFNKSDDGVHWSGLLVCVFTNIMNNRAQLKEGELQLPALFLLIIQEMRPSATFECAACACSHKNCVFGKIHSKFVKPWKMKKLTWDCEKGSETVWHILKTWELRGLQSCRVGGSILIKEISEKSNSVPLSFLSRLCKKDILTFTLREMVFFWKNELVSCSLENCSQYVSHQQSL